MCVCRKGTFRKLQNMETFVGIAPAECYFKVSVHTAPEAHAAPDVVMMMMMMMMMMSPRV